MGDILQLSLQIFYFPLQLLNDSLIFICLLLFILVLLLDHFHLILDIFGLWFLMRLPDDFFLCLHPNLLKILYKVGFHVDVFCLHVPALQLLYLFQQLPFLLFLVVKFLLFLPQLFVNLFMIGLYAFNLNDLFSPLLAQHLLQFFYLICILFQQSILRILIYDGFIFNKLCPGGISQRTQSFIIVVISRRTVRNHDRLRVPTQRILKQSG